MMEWAHLIASIATFLVALAGVLAVLVKLKAAAELQKQTAALQQETHDNTNGALELLMELQGQVSFQKGKESGRAESDPDPPR